MNKQRFDLASTEKKKASRWPFVLLDIWLLIGLVIGYNTHDYQTFIVLCIFGSLLTITHVIMALR